MKIRNVYLSLLVLATLACSTYAEDKFVVPTQKVQGVEEVVQAGEPIILQMSEIKDKPKYLADVRYDWKIVVDGVEKTKNVTVWPDGSKVIFGQGGAKEIKVIVVATYLYSVKEKEDDPAAKISEVAVRTSGIQFHSLKLQAPGPGPAPPNPPVPTPGPVFPDGKFGLSKTAYNLANTQVTNVDSKVKGSEAISTSMAGIASSIRAGALKDPTDILKKLKAANNSGLENAGVTLDDWDNFGSELQKLLYQLYKDGKLNTASDYADAFDEIVIGLRKVK